MNNNIANIMNILQEAGSFMHMLGICHWQKVFKNKLDVVQRRRATLRGESVLLIPEACVFSTLFSVCNIFPDIFILLFFGASEGHAVQDVQPEMEKPGALTTPISPKV